MVRLVEAAIAVATFARLAGGLMGRARVPADGIERLPAPGAIPGFHGHEKTPSVPAFPGLGRVVNPLECSCDLRHAVPGTLGLALQNPAGALT